MFSKDTFSCKFKYKLEKELAIVDALSKSFLEVKHNPFEEDIEAHVCVINAEIVMSLEKEKMFMDTTKDD